MSDGVLAEIIRNLEYQRDNVWEWLKVGGSEAKAQHRVAVLQAGIDAMRKAESSIPEAPGA